MELAPSQSPALEDPSTPRLESDSIEAECIICYEVPTTYGVLDSCSHTFCYDCISHWETRKDAADVSGQGPLTEKLLQARSSCPVCRRTFKILFPTPALLTDEDDRKEALETYKEMLSKTPCIELFNSPPERRYCPRGIDCLYSHTIQLAHDPTTTHTYTFTHTYHSHLLLESRLASERSAKRILSSLFSFAFTFDPHMTQDRASYARALSDEFDRIHASLTREETEDPLLWRLVEEVQSLAANFGIGGIVEDRMERLGRDPRLVGADGRVRMGSEADWSDEGEDEDGLDPDEEEEEDLESEDDFPRNNSIRFDANSSSESLPALEDIDRDEDNEALSTPRDSEEDARWQPNPVGSVTSRPVGSTDQVRLDILARRYETARVDEGRDFEGGWGSGSEDAEVVESEEEGEDSDASQPTSLSIGAEHSIANPLRRPRHPRTRPPPAHPESYIDWLLRDSPTAPRTPFRDNLPRGRAVLPSQLRPGIYSSTLANSRAGTILSSSSQYSQGVGIETRNPFVRWLRRVPRRNRPFFTGDSRRLALSLSIDGDSTDEGSTSEEAEEAEFEQDERGDGGFENVQQFLANYGQTQSSDDLYAASRPVPNPFSEFFEGISSVGNRIGNGWERFLMVNEEDEDGADEDDEWETARAEEFHRRNRIAEGREPDFDSSAYAAAQREMARELERELSRLDHELETARSAGFSGPDDPRLQQFMRGFLGQTSPQYESGNREFDEADEEEEEEEEGASNSRLEPQFRTDAQIRPGTVSEHPRTEYTGRRDASRGGMAIEVSGEVD